MECLFSFQSTPVPIYTAWWTEVHLVVANPGSSAHRFWISSKLEAVIFVICFRNGVQKNHITGILIIHSIIKSAQSHEAEKAVIIRNEPKHKMCRTNKHFSSNHSASRKSSQDSKMKVTASIAHNETRWNDHRCYHHNEYIGTCESEIFVRIESWIESAATIWIESRIEAGCSRIRVQCRLPQEFCRPTA